MNKTIPVLAILFFAGILAMTSVQADPVININDTIVNTTNMSATYYNVHFNFTDNNQSNATCQIHLDGIANVNSSNATTMNNTLSNLTLTYLGDGRYTWYVNCTNGTFAGRSATYEVTRDTVAPTININSSNSPANMTNITVNYANIVYNYTDILSGSANCSLYIDGIWNRTNATVLNNTNDNFTIVGMAAGSHTWYVGCEDHNGQEAYSGVYTIMYDATAPTVNYVGSLVNQTNVTVNYLTFSYNFTDVLSGSANCSLYVDGLWNSTNATVLNNTNTAISLYDLSQGSHSYYVGCEDHAGNEAYSSIYTMTYDAVGPTVNYVGSLVNQTNVTVNYMTFSYNFTDVLSATANCSLYVDGVWNSTNATVANNTNTAISLYDLSQATHTYYVGCEDHTGNEAYSSIYTMTYDGTAPTININASVVNLTNSTTTYYEVVFNYTDTLSSTAYCTLYYDGALNHTNTSLANNTMTNLTLTTIGTGAHTYYVNCSDHASNVGLSGVYTITSDATAPTMENTTSSATLNVTNSSTNVSVTVDIVDAIGGTTVYDVNMTTPNGTRTMLQYAGTSRWYYNDSMYNLGCRANATTCWFNLSARDGAGNTATTTINMTVDGVKPAVENSSVNDSTLLASDPITVVVAVYDANNISAVTVNGVSMSFSAVNNWTVDTTPTLLSCTQGTTCALNFTAIDNAGFYNTSHSTSITVSSGSAPTVNIWANNTNNTHTNNSNYEVVFNYTDSLWTNVSSYLYVNGIVNNTNVSVNGSNTTTLNATIGNEAAHTWYVKCTNPDGLSGLSGVYNLRYDATDPTLYNVTSSDSDNISNRTGTLTFYFDGTDAGGLWEVNISGNVTYNMTMMTSTRWGYNISPHDLGCDADASCQINFTAYDAAGNWREANFTITVDDTVPAVGNISFNVTWAKSTAAMNISVTANDINNVSTVYANSVLMAFSNDNNWSVDTTPNALGCTANGHCNVTFTVTDKAGNINDSSWGSFRVDNTVPTVTVVWPTANINTTNTSQWYNFTPSDNNDSQGNCSIYLNGVRNASNASVSFGNITSLTASLLAEGRYTSVLIYCEDRAGNRGVSTEIHDLWVDVSVPTITHNYPSYQHQNISDNTHTVSFTLADAGTGIALSTLTAVINGSVYTSSNLTCTGNALSYTCTKAVTINDSATNLWVNITVSDQSGKQNTSNLTYGINTVAPGYPTGYTAPASANVSGLNATGAGSHLGNFNFTDNVSATAAPYIITTLGSGGFTFGANLTTRAELVGNKTWNHGNGSNDLYITLDNNTIDFTINGTRYFVNYTGHNATLDFNMSTNVSHVCDYINTNVSSTVCYNTSNKFNFSVGFGTLATIYINNGSANTWLGLTTGNSSNGTSVSNRTFSVVVDGTLYSFNFNRTAVNLSVATVVSYINTYSQAHNSVNIVTNNSNETMSFLSNTTGLTSKIMIGNYTVSNAVLGLTDNATSIGNPF
ncbi:MAG: hypothetical protein KKG59_06675, partial [Nanoarchaeota archaeon]|nr:hypothetical protein [Nanoarchaeota archaeon]